MFLCTVLMENMDNDIPISFDVNPIQVPNNEGDNGGGQRRETQNQSEFEEIE